MSPKHSGRVPCVRDQLIARMALPTMRAYGLSRSQANELLASLSPDERSFLWRLKARALHFSKKGKPMLP